MPGANSFAGIVSGAQRLLAAVAQNADQLQAAEAHRAELEAALNQFKKLAGRRDNLKAEKQVLSRQMRAAGERVNDATIDLKALIKATMGSRSEKLIEFLMAPRRKVLRTDRDPRKAVLKRPPTVDAESPAAKG